MKDTNSKIVILADYVKARSQLSTPDIRELLESERLDLRKLDREVIELLSTKKHKLKQIQKRKDVSVRIDGNLSLISDWIEDEIALTSLSADKENLSRLLTQCERSMARLERVKKTISDDLAACRYAEGKRELDPMRIAGFLLAGVIGAGTFEKTYMGGKDADMWVAAETGAALGLLLSFHRQVKDFCVASGKVIASSPRHLQSLHQKARFSAAASALTIVVMAKRTSDIEPRVPTRNATNAKTVIEAKI